MLWTAARIAAEKAVPANSMILTRATGTPRLRAALAEPPTPVIQLPNLVRPRMYAPIGREQDPPQDRDLEVCRRMAPVEEPGDRVGGDQRPGDRDVA